MLIAAIISLSLTVLLFVLSLAFKVAGKLRLSPPLIYFLLFSTVLNKWAGEHETIAFVILFSLLGLAIVSWVVSLVKMLRRKRDEKRFEDDIAWQIQRAREMGVPMDNIQFSESGDLIDPRTGKPMVFGANAPFKNL